MASIRLEDVHKTYPNGHVAARGIDLAVADGELVVLVGPSGCGKSTVLRIVAGLETPTRGRVLIGDRDVTRVRVQERDVAMVFQSYALYPHKTVRKNLALALELRKVPAAEIRRRVEEVARTLAIDELLERKPGQLSGGQRQRVALGRAIVREPKAFLFDEPLSNLDARLRVETRAELTRLHRRLGATMIYVTHDQEEAMTLGDRIAVVHEGRVQQCAAPLEVYRRPANVFVAGFVGSPAINLLAARLTVDGATARVQGAGFAIDLDRASGLSARPSVRLGVRPEDVEIVDPACADLSGTVDIVEPLGATLLAHIAVAEDTAGGGFRLVTSPDAGLRAGDAVGLRLRRDRLHLFDGETGMRL